MCAEVLVLAGGISTSLATALSVFLIQSYSGEDVSSYMAWFILPIGSGLCGFAAASGYYALSRYTGVPPTRRLAVNMTLIGLSTYGLIQLLSYYGTTIDGVPVSRVASFWTYYRAAIESTQLVSMNHPSMEPSPDPLGALGYGYELLRVIGFLVGAFVVWTYLSAVPYCPECHRYYKRSKLVSTRKAEDIDEFISGSGLNFPGLVEAFSTKLKTRRPNWFNISLHSCPTCNRKEFRFGFTSGRDNIEVGRYTHRGEFNIPVLSRAE
jgi:hypothetical protein